MKGTPYTINIIKRQRRGRQGNRWYKPCTSFKEAMGPIEFFNKSKENTRW